MHFWLTRPGVIIVKVWGWAADQTVKMKVTIIGKKSELSGSKH